MNRIVYFHDLFVNNTNILDNTLFAIVNSTLLFTFNVYNVQKIYTIKKKKNVKCIRYFKFIYIHQPRAM